MRTTTYRIAALVCLGAFAQAGFAADAAPAMGPVVAASASAASNAQELATLQSQYQILKWKAKIAAEQAQIDAAQQKGRSSATGPLGAVNPTVLPAPYPTSGAANARAASPHLQLLGVTGFNGKLTAEISADGVSRDVHVGDVVAGGWRVQTIRASTVELVRGRAIRTLGF